MPATPAIPPCAGRSLDREPGGWLQIVSFARRTASRSASLSGAWSAPRPGGWIRSGLRTGIASAIKDNNVVYQSYWDKSAGGVLALQDVPEALSLWKQYFGPGGTLAGTPW